MKRALLSAVVVPALAMAANGQELKAATNPYLQVMEKAWVHAKAHGAVQPVLSPVDATILNGEVPLKELQARGFKVVPWTTNDPEKMRTQIRMGVDGLITDRPDLLQQVVGEERDAAKTAEERVRLAKFDVTAHRGGRGLRPENTLPSFESGLDQLVTTLETDTGVTTDGVSLIWHDQFLNPESCRRADGTPYTLENRVFLRDISSTDAQKTFICDKVHFDAEQKNDLSLSPVAVAFAKKEGLISPYVPTYAAQLFRFVNFYVEYYTKGPGKGTAHAKERAQNAAHARFNIETKIMPEGIATDEEHKNHTVGPQAFVDALCGAIEQNKMVSRAEVQSFDFRTLWLIAEQHPKIPTYYLTGSMKLLSSPLVPEQLRATADNR
ncbi:glycerophosphodiester phosphodiesterase family protein [Edaphobacter albus]|uniref:glycerophosphodiester phosphodiesterase family protein n=1 Tax=Edaphobacter sp. 4G125 TaxID=2763071 RepID=UPI00164577DC|nr:glycerophosphodiester phosphodiesterase family protein [Edaphobacter sp. 4G125]QNI36874.1 glycerophosphodiester phosphodiesterase [Edaphobacter sp. 4G125]